MTFIDFLNYLFKPKVIAVVPSPDPVIPVQTKEDYYNTKYPATDVCYVREETDGEHQIDVRQFLNPENYQLPKLNSISDDDKALEGLKWVIQYIKYVDDKTDYNYPEYWAYGYQTQQRAKGDCEDGAILLYDILRHNEIPAWKLRVTAGNVLLNNQKVGHCYLNYYVESEDKWCVLDWCYWPTDVPVAGRKAYKDDPNYLDVWFSFNELFSWSKGLNSDANNFLNKGINVKYG